MDTSKQAAGTGEGEAGRSGRSAWRSVRAWIIGTAVAVVAFDLVAAFLPVAQRGLRAFEPWEARPPVYGYFQPTLSRYAVAAFLLAALAAAGPAAARRLKAPAFVASAIVFLLAFSAAVAMIDGRPRYLDEGINGRIRSRDARLADEVGLRTIVRTYDRRVEGFATIHSKTHPPGRLVVQGATFRLFPDQRWLRPLALAGISVLVLIPAWFIGLRVGGPTVARYGILLLAVAPAPVIFTFTSSDTVDALGFTTAMALLMWGGVLGPGRRVFAFAGGFVLGLSVFTSYGAGFVALAAGLLALMTTSFREAAKTLAVAAAGGVIALLVLNVSFGFDPISSYAASHRAMGIDLNTDRSHLFWLFGAPAAWLTMAGAPIAGLSVRELVAGRSRFLIAIAAPLAAFYVLPVQATRIIPGELERTLVWVYPYAAVAAAVALVRAEEAGRARSWVLGALVAVSALQTVLIESLYRTIW